MFKLARTFNDPSSGPNAQRGYPAPGAGEQTVGDWSPPQPQASWESARPTKGARSWFRPGGATGGQQGFAPPEDGGQRRPPSSMPNRPPQYGGNIEVWTPYFSRGAAAYVQNYGKVLTNPIGAGVVAMHRPQASYGPAAQYANGAIWWTSQAIPTSVNLQGLTDPAALAAYLGPINVQAVIRTTG